MGISPSIVELLKRERIPYTWFQHKLIVHRAGRSGGLTHSRALVGQGGDLHCRRSSRSGGAARALRRSISNSCGRLRGRRRLRLAREEELATLYPDSEVGAMPPFGAVYRTSRVRRAVSGRRTRDGLQRRHAHRRHPHALRRFRGSRPPNVGHILPLPERPSECSAAAAASGAQRRQGTNGRTLERERGPSAFRRGSASPRRASAGLRR